MKNENVIEVISSMIYNVELLKLGYKIVNINRIIKYKFKIID